MARYRYTGALPLEEHIATEIRERSSGAIELPTDKGTLRFSVMRYEGDVVSGKTLEDKLVTIHIRRPDNITVT